MFPLFNIDEEIVKIKTISIGGRRMTKSVFGQILYYRAFDNAVNFTGDKIIGFVNDAKIIWLIFVKNDEIRKCALTHIVKLSHVNELTTVGALRDLEVQLGLGYFQRDNEEISYYAKDCYASEDWEKINILVDNAKSFLNTLDGRQIFIAS